MSWVGPMPSKPARSVRRLVVSSVLAGLGLLACGPGSSISRISDEDGGISGTGGDSPSANDAGTGGTGAGSSGTGGAATGGASGTGGTAAGGSPGTGGSAPTDNGSGGSPVIDAAPPEPDVTIDEPVAAPPDLAIPRQALLVVGDPAALTAGDTRLRTALRAHGFTVVVGDDAGTTGDANHMDLVVIGSSCASSMVGAKFRDIAIPVLDMEASIFDDMKMTGPTAKTDYDEEDDRRITMIAAQASHPLAAGLAGSVTVNSGGVDPCCGINWGKPASSAKAIASYTSASNGKIAIFAYDKAAKMVDNFSAPARRVGFFAADTTMANLADDGLKLLDAAITWTAQ
jgi:hypothetical protein